MVPRLMNGDKLVILVSGAHTWHRSPDTLIDALICLKSRSLIHRVSAFICGQGDLTQSMKTKAEKHALPVSFEGFVSLEKLMALHNRSHIVVAAGRSEPWGIRVNDAINAGCMPLVSDGMGVEKIVRNSGFGEVFRAGDPEHLADVLEQFIEAPNKYNDAYGNRDAAIEMISSERRAIELSNWLNAMSPDRERRNVL